MRSFPETYKITAQNMNMDCINNTANTKGETDGQTWRRLKRIAIGQLHDDDIWLQLPEFISVLLCYLNLSIPLRTKEQ